MFSRISGTLIARFKRDTFLRYRPIDHSNGRGGISQPRRWYISLTPGSNRLICIDNHGLWVHLLYARMCGMVLGIRPTPVIWLLPWKRNGKSGYFCLLLHIKSTVYQGPTSIILKETSPASIKEINGSERLAASLSMVRDDDEEVEW